MRQLLESFEWIKEKSRCWMLPASELDDINLVIIHLKNDLLEAKKRTTAAIGNKMSLKKKFDELATQVKDWERRASLATQAGDQKAAREALVQQKEYENLVVLVEAQYRRQEEFTNALKGLLRILTSKIELLTHRKNILEAQRLLDGPPTTRAEQVREIIGRVKETIPSVAATVLTTAWIYAQEALITLEHRIKPRRKNM